MFGEWHFTFEVLFILRILICLFDHCYCVTSLQYRPFKFFRSDTECIFCILYQADISLTTLGNGVSNFTAQNIGAKKLPRVKEGFKAGIRLVWVICVPLTAAYLFAGKYLVYIFLDHPTGTAMEVGVRFLQILSPFYFVVSAKLVSDGVLRGAGMMKQFMSATFTDLILRVALAKILSMYFGTTGIWAAWPIGWTVAMILSVMFCRSGVWSSQKKKLHFGHPMKA